MKTRLTAICGLLALMARVAARKSVPKASSRVPKGVSDGLRTANSAACRLSALVTANAPDISALPDGGWFVISPYGSHPSPDRSYTQVFSRAQADRVVRTWNSLPGTAVRWFKNRAHGIKGKFSAPIWDGHPDQDADRWPEEKLLGEVEDLRATDTGLEGRVTWNAANEDRRTRGPLYPSAYWWHFPKDALGRVFPELLESIGLVPTPNISAVPAWTANATLDPALAEVLPQPTTTEDIMDRKALARKLGLPEDATEEQITAKIAENVSTANAAAENIRTANSARESVQGQLTTANTRITSLEAEKGTLTTQLSTATGQVTALTGEKQTLATANADLVNINRELAAGVVHGFELGGVITPAEREKFAGLVTANATAVATVADLKKKKPVMNVTSIQLGADKKDISTANARRQVFNDAVKRRMVDHKETYDQAFAACTADPALKGVLDAMTDPSRPAA